jgi:hypothetical protein
MKPTLANWLAHCIAHADRAHTTAEIREAELALGLAARWPPVQQALDLPQQDK